MSKEIIQHNNKKVTKTTKQSGNVSYSIKGVYRNTEKIKIKENISQKLLPLKH